MGNRQPFEKRIDRSGDCWLWLGARSSAGYGQVYVNGRVEYAHRVAWERAHGHPVPPGHHILHTCDTPPCVRPEHLFIGTHAENMLDKASKGRAALRLTPDDVREIRRRYVGGESQDAIAGVFGVSRPNVGYIVRGETWKWVAM